MSQHTFRQSRCSHSPDENAGGVQPQTQLPLPASSPLLLGARQSGEASGGTGLQTCSALRRDHPVRGDHTHTGELTVQGRFLAFRLVTASLSAPPPWSPGGHGVKGSDSRQCPLHSGPGSQTPPGPLTEPTRQPRSEQRSSSTSKGQRASGLQGHPQFPLIWMPARRGGHGVSERTASSLAAVSISDDIPEDSNGDTGPSEAHALPAIRSPR